jgi:hypothetical protein
LETAAYFSNIRYHITGELKKATKSVYVAVAWITDVKLFTILLEQAQKGLDVQLIVIDDDITRNCSIDYHKLEAFGGKLYMINTETTGTLMHNKFCIIDESTTITGSYNWSVKAQSNHENVTITQDDQSLAGLFLSEFRRIKERYHGRESLKAFDGEVIGKRLTIIDNLIQLDEYDQLNVHIAKLNEYELTEEVFSIGQALTSTDYRIASSKIRDYLIRIKSLTVFEEADLEQLKWEIKYLEIEIVSLESEKATIEKVISDFVHTYTVAFGELISRILNLKKEKLKKQGNISKSFEYEKAEDDYREFNESFRKAKEEQHENLNDQQKDELKQKYRKAVVLCHPDKFTDEEMKAKAHKVFVELQDAYLKNELSRVCKILGNLENGSYEIEEDQVLTKKQQLLERLDELRSRYKELMQELIAVRRDKTYQDVISIRHLGSFFEEERERLENELKILENESQQFAC